MSRSLPYSSKVEMSLLGAVLLKPEILAWLEVDVGCFHVAQNRAVWAAMVAIHGRGLTVDEVSLEAELARNGVLKSVGGLAFIGRIALACASSTNAGTYVATLEEYRITRNVMEVAAEVQAKIEGRDKLFGAELLDRMVSQLGLIKRTKSNELTSVEDTIPEMIRRIIEDVDSQAKGIVGSSFVPTGIEALDFAIGGIPRGTVTAIGGRPGAGKSSLLLNLSEHAANLGETAVIFTTEDPRDRWNERLLAKHSQVAVDRIYTRDLKPLELGKLAVASDKVRAIKGLHIVHAHGMSAQEMTRTALVFGATLMGVDYAQKVRAPEPGMKLHESIEASSKVFGDFAGKHGVALVDLSQMSKETEKEQRRPRLSDLRYGDGLAQEAKLALLIHDPDSAQEPGLREILIAKRNQGEKDLVIKVGFDGEHCSFGERKQKTMMGIDDF